MVELLMATLGLPILVGLIVSFLIEGMLKPRPMICWQRNWASLTIHLGLYLLLFVAVFLLVQRPWFATIIILAFILLVVQVSNAKFHSLREPFIFQDFEYFSDAIKHPRLYLPFLGLWRALVIAIGFGMALFAGLTLESSLFDRVPMMSIVMVVIVPMVLGSTLLWLGARQKLLVSFEVEADLYQWGLIASLWRYGEEEQIQYSVSSPFNLIDESLKPEILPNLVVVQSESFFDARRLCADIRPDVLDEFDKIKRSAIYQGQIEVPAWGANTVRTEFAFLSGLDIAELGIHRFNPYRKLAQQGIPSIASFLRNKGYRTVCVHPYQASFYTRDKVFPLLGFDEFIDISHFDGVENTGPYIGDVSLAEKVCGLLEQASAQPIFVFVITMENHGPLHLEKVLDGDISRLYSTPPPVGCDDLTIYLRHLKNADRMASMLRDKLNSIATDSVLCWYGDHVPIMPKVYELMRSPKGQTDYFIWKNNQKNSDADETKLNIKIENLAGLLLETMAMAAK
jgi:hypothetical protein